jgi:hypothetical protein
MSRRTAILIVIAILIVVAALVAVTPASWQGQIEP